jgi:hypothetical protein
MLTYADLCGPMLPGKEKEEEEVCVEWVHNGRHGERVVNVGPQLTL